MSKLELHKMTIRWLILPAELLTHYTYQAISCLIIELLIKTKAFVSPIDSQPSITEPRTIIYSERAEIYNKEQNINTPFPFNNVLQ